MPYDENRWWEPFYDRTISETVGGSASPAYQKIGYLTGPAGVAGLSSASNSHPGWLRHAQVGEPQRQLKGWKLHCICNTADSMVSAAIP